MHNTFGLLGGWGPRALADIHTRIIDHSLKLGNSADHEFPQLVLTSLPGGGLDGRGKRLNKELLHVDLNRAFAAFTAANVHEVYTTCNTLDLYLEGFPCTSITDVVAGTVGNSVRGGEKIGVLASATTRANCLYEKAFAKTGVSLPVVYHPQQQLIDAAIEMSMRGEEDVELVAALIADLANKGCDIVILGCSELHHLTTTTNRATEGVWVVDSADILAAHIAVTNQERA